LATLVAALLILPFGGAGAAVSFPGDLIVLAGLFALGRFVTRAGGARHRLQL
jgi:formate hydrogenlyase subunit 4